MSFLKGFLGELGYTVLSESSCNAKRDLFIVVKRDGVVSKFYIKFRVSPAFDSGKPVGFFQSFAEQFPEFYKAHCDLGCFGESVNLSVLEDAVRMGADKILFCFADEKVFWVYPLLFLNFGKEHNLIRQQYWQNSPVPETTISIPFGLLNKFEEESLQTVQGVIGND